MAWCVLFVSYVHVARALFQSQGFCTAQSGRASRGAGASLHSAAGSAAAACAPPLVSRGDECSVGV